MQSSEAQADFKQASACYQRGDFAQAMALLDKLAQESPTNKEVVYSRARCLGKLGRTEEALRICEYLSDILKDPRGDRLREKLAQDSGDASTKRRPLFEWLGRNLVSILGAVVLLVFIGLAAMYVLSGSEEGNGKQVADAAPSTEPPSIEPDAAPSIDREESAPVVEVPAVVMAEPVPPTDPVQDESNELPEANTEEAVVEVETLPEHTLSFPENQNLGRLYIRDMGSDDYQDWESFADALASVTIPAGKEVMMVQRLQDLSALSTLDPNAIQVLRLDVANFEGAELRHIHHLTGLTTFSLGDAEISETQMIELKAALPTCSIR